MSTIEDPDIKWVDHGLVNNSHFSVFVKLFHLKWIGTVVFSTVLCYEWYLLGCSKIIIYDSSMSNLELFTDSWKSSNQFLEGFMYLKKIDRDKINKKCSFFTNVLNLRTRNVVLFSNLLILLSKFIIVHFSLAKIFIHISIPFFVFDVFFLFCVCFPN